MQQVQTLSPAQKAWVTRRAKAAAMISVAAPEPFTPANGTKPVICRVHTDADLIRPEAVGELRPAFEPVTEFQMVSLYVDEARLGCGVRRFIVLDIGERVVRLFNAPTLLTITVARKYFDKRAREAKTNRKTLAELIRGTLRMAERINDEAERGVIDDGGADTQRALDLLESRTRH